MAWPIANNKFISFQDAYDSPFTKHYAITPSAQFMTKTDIIYYLDVVHANLDGITAGQWAWASLLSSATVYQSAYYYESATRNNCGVESNPTTVTLIASTGQFTSTVSQVDANNQAINWVQANKQTYANNYAQCILRATAWRGITPFCIQRPVYYSVATSGTFNRNNCGSYYVGSAVTYTVAANTYSSMVSQADANSKAQADIDANGQNYANTNGTCISTLLHVGDSYGGGIVGYLLQYNDVGYDANIQHGIIAAPSDQALAMAWWNGSNVTTYKLGIDTLMGGYEATQNIVNIQGTGNYAASLCWNLVLNGYNDWALPTRSALVCLHTNKALIGNFADFPYWSSNERNNYNDQAYMEDFGSMYQGSPILKSQLARVRAVRHF